MPLGAGRQQSLARHERLYCVRTAAMSWLFIPILGCEPIPPVIFLLSLTRQMNGKISIKEVLRLEEDLNSSSPAPSVERDAKVNLLKYLQISAVKKYEEAYDGLFYELNKEGGLERLRSITPVRSRRNFLQPKVYDLRGCGGVDGCEVQEQADVYLEDAKLAKLRLDELMGMVVETLEGCEVQHAEVKSRESTVRKANKSYAGNVRRVADMARVAVVCKTPEILEQVYMGIMGRLQVREPFFLSTRWTDGTRSAVNYGCVCARARGMRIVASK